MRLRPLGNNNKPSNLGSCLAYGSCALSLTCSLCLVPCALRRFCPQNKFFTIELVGQNRLGFFYYLELNQLYRRRSTLKLAQLMKKPAVLLATLFIIATADAQSVTGSWYGRADPDIEGRPNNYLTELIIRQKGDDVEGVFAYYFKNFYKSFFVRGKYNKASRQVIIKNIPVVHFRSTGPEGIDCSMEFVGTLMVSKAKSTLKGYFFRPEKYKYTCPDLRASYTLDNNQTNLDSALRNTIATLKTWAPLPEDVVISNTTSTESNNNGHFSTVTEESLLLDKYMSRKNIVQQEVTVGADSVRISFFDNGDIDGDSISVFMNGKPILFKQELEMKALNLYLKLDTTKAVNEITMFAENLGKYPPNTALMVIFDGEKRTEVYLSSSLTQNATVRLRRR